MWENKTYTIADFKPTNQVKWCAWCWDLLVLNRLQNQFVKSWLPKENFVVVAWIGCAWRLPYYMNTYWFHTIHGRAPAVATWVKLANPELQVWIATWDWDALSIGGNHIIHTIRKNIWVKILLLNNSIYWLTKWQLSPTSNIWSITKTSPIGSIETPINPSNFAISLWCSFVARTIDSEIPLTDKVLEEWWKNSWTVFIEVLQKCITFNPKYFEELRNPETKEDYILRVENGQPLVFGKAKNKCIIIENFKPKIVEFSEKLPENVIIYDETSNELAYIISKFSYPEFPIPVWILYRNNNTSYEELLANQNKKIKSIDKIINDWEVFEI